MLNKERVGSQRERMRTRLSNRISRPRPWLFYAVSLGLFAFFAVAVVHELIPGLCPILEGEDEECPFCELIYTLTLAVVVLLCACCCFPVRIAARHPAQCFPQRRPRLACSPRAPPAA